MKRTTGWLAAALAAGIAWTVFAQQQGARPGAEAPDFSLRCLQGNEHTLRQFRGRWVVLEWTNYDCPFVRKFYSGGHMQRWQREVGGREDSVWLTICSSAPGQQGHFDAETWARRNTEWNVAPTALLLDPDGRVGRAYGATHTPHMYVIDPEGTLVYMGAIDSIRSANPADIERAENYVLRALENARAGRPVEPAQTRAYGCTVKYAN